MARPARQTTEEDALPEADRLEPFPHPRFTEHLFGHADSAAEFASGIGSGRCHHAWLICGPKGVGKATLAYQVARFALAEAHERDATKGLAVVPGSVAARQVAALSHPGLMVIRRPYDTQAKRFKTVITIDEVRRLRSFLGHTAGGGGWRVVIVDAADDMNIAAANGLLKTLEEPPSRTLFLLVCAEPGRLMATVRSRCRMIQLAPVGLADLGSAARQAMAGADGEVSIPEDAQLDAIARRAGGSVGRLLMLAAAGGAKLAAAVDDIFARLPDVAWSEVHALADDVTGTEQAERFELLYTLILERISAEAQVACMEAGEGGTPGVQKRLSGRAVLASWAELWETLLREKAGVEALNLDRRSLLLDTIARLRSTLRS